MYEDQFIASAASDQSEEAQEEVTLTKLVGLMECGIEPKYHDGMWSVLVIDHLHEHPIECTVASVVISELKRYEFGEVEQRGEETVFAMKKIA